MSVEGFLLNTVKWFTLYDYLSTSIKSDPYLFNNGDSEFPIDYSVWREGAYSVHELIIQEEYHWFTENENWLLLQKGLNNGVNILYHSFKDDEQQQIPIEKCSELVERLYRRIKKSQASEKLPSPRSHFFYTNVEEWSTLYDYLNIITSTITIDKPYTFEDLDSENPKTGYNAWQTTNYSDDTLVIQEDADWFSMNENRLLLQKGPTNGIKVIYSMFKSSDGQRMSKDKCTALLGHLYHSIKIRVEITSEIEKNLKISSELTPPNDPLQESTCEQILTLASLSQRVQSD